MNKFWFKEGTNHILLNDDGVPYYCEECPCEVPCNDCTSCGGTSDFTLSSVTIHVPELTHYVSSTCGTVIDVGDMTGNKTAIGGGAYAYCAVKIGAYNHRASIVFDTTANCWKLVVLAVSPSSGIVWRGCKGGNTPVGTYYPSCSCAVQTDKWYVCAFGYVNQAWTCCANNQGIAISVS